MRASICFLILFPFVAQADEVALEGADARGRPLSALMTTSEAAGGELEVTVALEAETYRGTTQASHTYELQLLPQGSGNEGGMLQRLPGSRAQESSSVLWLRRRGDLVRARLVDGQGAPLAQLEGRAGLSASQIAAIGRKIWRNECGGTVEGLTHWNTGEEFPSLGIGHFIWYPAGFRGPFSESFPELVRFAQERGARDVPPVALAPHAPWESKAAFDAAFHGPELSALRTWLATKVALQTEFIIRRSRAALPRVLAAASAAERARIAANYDKVASTPNGTYALIDYVNFKGEGTHPSERYQGEGWGLLQVLLDMRDVPAGQPAAQEFAAAAIRVLDRRIANAPPARGESRWAEGWHNRCRTYAKPL